MISVCKNYSCFPCLPISIKFIVEQGVITSIHGCHQSLLSGVDKIDGSTVGDLKYERKLLSVHTNSVFSLFAKKNQLTKNQEGSLNSDIFYYFRSMVIKTAIIFITLIDQPFYVGNNIAVNTVLGKAVGLSQVIHISKVHFQMRVLAFICT